MLNATGTQPIAVSGIDTFDGRGNLTSNSTLIVNGMIIYSKLIVPTGTYTVREDCTGTLTLGVNGVELDIFVSADGEAFDYVQTAPPGAVLAGTIRRVSRGIR